MVPGEGDELFCWVCLDQDNPPKQMLLAWHTDNWEHRAYWGENLINLGTDNTESRRFMGGLPPVGEWYKLRVPAAEVGLEGALLTAWGSIKSDGAVYLMMQVNRP